MSDLDKLGGLAGGGNPLIAAIHRALSKHPGPVLESVPVAPDGMVVHLEDGTRWLVTALPARRAGGR